MEEDDECPYAVLGMLKEYLGNEDNASALAVYLHFFSQIPDSERSRYELRFSEFLYSYGKSLIFQDVIKTADLYDIYNQSLEFFPRSVKILNEFGKCLMEIDHCWNAYTYLTKAYEIDKDYLPNESNLKTTKLRLLPRWHYRMLNDIVRNKAYFNAINLEITSKYNKVLDIGAGCGLLSVYASKNKNTKQIIAIEESENLSNICEQAIKFEKLQVINSSSLALNKNSTSLSNILVTEIFDTALFGEHVLKSLIHAHENLLEDDFKIIPSSADVYIMAIECPDLQRKYWVPTENINSLNIQSVCLHADDYTYDAQFIKDYNFKKITEPYKFITVDFENLDQLKNLYENVNFIPKFDLKAIDSGFVQAFIVWFELKLGNETITTNPFDDNSCKCWEQAVLFPKHQFHITEGTSIEKIQMTSCDSLLKIEIGDSNVHYYHCFYIPEEIIQFLNDSDLINNICSVVNDFKVSDLVVIDLLPFPIFGILMAARNNRVIAIMESGDLVELVEKFCFLNNINHELITFVTKDEFDEMIITPVNFCDVIFFNPIAKNGMVNELIYANYGLYVNILKENGVILPKNVYVEFEVVNCEYFEYCQKVKEENVLDDLIPRLINEFRINEHLGIDNHLEYKPLTKSARLPLNSEVEDCTSSCSLMIEEDGVADSILYWYFIDFNNNFYSTKKSFYYNKAAFILEKPFNVVKGNKITFTKKQHLGIIKLNCMLE